MSIFSAEAAQTKLLDELAEELDDTTLSDLTIRVGDTSFQCHRLVLKLQSPWFRKALTGGFKESGSNELTLQDDDPEAMKALVEFCYQFDYTSPNKTGGALQFHVRVFSVAEKYLMPHLQHLARDKFANTLANPCESGDPFIDFCEAVRLAYTETTDPQRLLRTAMVEQVNKHSAPLLLDLVPGPVLETMESVPMFAADIARKLAEEKDRAQEALKKRRFMCPGSCGGVGDVIIPDDDVDYTFSCFRYGDSRHTFKGHEWQKFLAKK